MDSSINHPDYCTCERCMAVTRRTLAVTAARLSNAGDAEDPDD